MVMPVQLFVGVGDMLSLVYDGATERLAIFKNCVIKFAFYCTQSFTYCPYISNISKIS